MKNTFIYTVTFTFVLCFVFVLILSFANAATIDIIEGNRSFERDQAILKSLGIQGIDTKEQVKEKIVQVETVEINNTLYHKTELDGTTVYSTKFSGPGLWGTISGYIAVDDVLQTIRGFSVTSQNETPGLGARIGEAWFYQQLTGEAIINNNIEVRKGGSGDLDKSNGQIDGVTGATRTSDSIQAILTKSIQQFIKDLQ